MPEITTLTQTDTYAKIVLEPLDRGYGQTIGNALRRVLLSSVQGAAIMAVRIDGVFHEFSEIPGVKEDATEFLLNIKDIAIDLEFDQDPPEETELTLNVKGPGRVTAADIVCPDYVKVVNPDAYIATISDKNASLGASFYVGWGQGYVVPDRHEKYKGSIGVIATGSQFTPVRKVNYVVEQTRVGQRTDYERLILEVETNGAVSPNDAVTQAAHILDKFFKLFFELGDVRIASEEKVSVEVQDYSHMPEIKVEELDLTPRTYNCLRRAGILTLRHLASKSEADLASIRGFGKKSLVEVRERMQDHGIELPGGRMAVTFEDDDLED